MNFKMNMFLPMLIFVSMALAEPPVGDGYPASQSSHDPQYRDEHNDQQQHHQPSEHQRSPSQEYGVPSSASSRNPLSTEYGVPNARTTLNSRGPSRKYAPPAVRVSFNQRFRSSSRSNSGKERSAPSGRSYSQERMTPNSQSGISDKYGVPAARSLSQEYGVPSIVSARTLSTEYGMPDARSTPSEEYGVPSTAARNKNPQSPVSNFRNTQPAKSSFEDYTTPEVRSNFKDNSRSHSSLSSSARSNDVIQQYSEPAAKSQLAESTLSQGRSTAVDSNEVQKDSPRSGYALQNPSQSYGTPQNADSITSEVSASRSSSYNVPSLRKSDSNDHAHDSVSENYGVPNQGDVFASNNATNTRRPSTEYGVPSSRAAQNSESIHSSSSARSVPSSTYPSDHDVMPSQQYGVPEQDNKGYDYAKARALDDLLNQEPASYDFAYQIEDQESGADFGHSETREDNRAEGSYFVVLPDGTKQTVDYEADERGFKPRISVEPAAAPGGYDENAADIARSSQGPY